MAELLGLGLDLGQGAKDFFPFQNGCSFLGKFKTIETTLNECPYVLTLRHLSFDLFGGVRGN